MRRRPAPGPSPIRSRSRFPLGSRSRSDRLTRPIAAALLVGAVTVVSLTTACAPTVAGQAAPANGAMTSTRSAGTPTTDPSPSTRPRTSTASPTPRTSTHAPGTRTDTQPALPAADGTDPLAGSAVTTSTATDRAGTGTGPATAAAAGWAVVPPAGLETWQSVPADDVSWIWRSDTCLLVVSAPADVPDMTDERFARAHLRYAVNQWITQIEPTITESGDYLSQDTDPVRVSDPTRTQPPAVHLQLSGFRYHFPTIGVTDQTYSFVTQGGGQGFVVSAVCSEGDFSRRYDTEIAALVAGLGVDTGI